MDSQTFKPQYMIGKRSKLKTGNHFASIFTNLEIWLMQPSGKDFGQVIRSAPDTFGQSDEGSFILFFGWADDAFAKVKSLFHNKISGGAKGIRTPGLMIANLMPYNSGSFHRLAFLLYFSLYSGFAFLFL